MSSPIFFKDHWQELRRRLIISLSTLAGVASVSFLFSEALVEGLIAVASPVLGTLYYFDPAGAFLIRFRLSILAGFIISGPVLAYQFWRFVAPGLYSSEKRLVAPLALIVSFLFALGSFFAYRVIIPITLHFLASYQSGALKPLIAVDRYFDFVITLMIGFGVAFNLPVFVAGLVAVGAVRHEQLVKYRPHAYVSILILASLLTPPDVLSQLAMTFPLVGLFELSLLVTRFWRRRSPTETFVK